MSKRHVGDSPGNRILFRSCGAIVAVTLLIFAIRFASHRDGTAGWVSLLFGIGILLFTLIKDRPTAIAWFSFWGLVALAVVVLGILEM